MLKQKACKRFLPWLLAIAMLFSLLPVGALAEPPTEDSGTPDVAFRCLDSEGSADVSVGDYDSSTTTETLFADTSSDVISLTADSPEDSLKEGVIEDTDISVQFDKAVVLENGDIPETQEALEEEGTEISAVIKTDNDFACLPAEGGKPVNLGEDQTLVIIYKEEEATSDADADNEEEETEDEANANDIAALLGGAAFGIVPFAGNSGSYPVYVYGRFMNGDEPLKHGTKIVKNDVEKDIIWNGTTSNYITFGKIGAVSPLADPNKIALGSKGEAKTATDKLGNMVSYTQGDKNFTTDDVTTWDLHTSLGATNYDNTSGQHDWAWHLDGDIHVYQIAYDANADEDSVTGMPRNDGKYYFGSYTVSTEKPSREGYIFKGWTLNGETVITEIEDLKTVGGTNATITLKAKWEKDSYPVYVYGYLVNGSGNAGASLGKGAKIIKDNGDAKAFINNDYSYGNYITFGKIDKATTIKPVDKNTTPEAFTDAQLQEKLAVLGDGTDLQNNGFSWKDVSAWLLKIANGATNYGHEITTNDYSWHLDGKINVYKIKYLDNANGNDISADCGITPNAYYCGTYNVSNYAPTREGYTFDGWDVAGTTYEAGNTLTLADFGDAETITLTAKWEKKQKVVNVTYNWGSDVPSDVTIPTGGTYNSEAEARAAMDETFTSASTSRAQKDGKDGLWKFSGWTENVTTSDDGNKVTIALTGSWTFTEKKYHVVYSWTAAPNELTVPTDSTEYSSKEDINKDTTYVNGYKYTTADGIYTFNGWNDGTERTNDEGTLTTITFTGSWTFASKQYKVVYNWNSDNGVPENVALPTDNNSYTSEATAKEAMDKTFTSASTSTAQKDGKDGLWKFSGWTASAATDSTVEENTAIITFTGSWNFTQKVVNVTYDWGSDVPSGVTIPEGGTYNSEAEARADMDKTFTSESTSTAQKDGKDGLWKFSGWTENVTTSDDGNKVTIALTGSWSFTQKVVNVTYDWGSDVPSGVTIPEGGTYNSEAAAKEAMDKTFTSESTSKAPNGNIAGTWKFSGWTENVTTSDDGNKVTITFTGFWSFTSAETETITDVLNNNKLIQKAFESRYGYSTEGTFTAKATVMLDLPIPMAADDEYEPEVIGIYNGTVTLKTGETKAFSFTAADANQPDTLEANTTYVVKATEDNANLSNVDYDKTEYTLTFTTDENGVAGNIAITPNNGDETTDKITFHNIYTYKRHSSNNGSQSSTSNTPPTVEITDDEALGLNNTDHFAYIVGYGNGEVRPQNSITRAEVAAIFFRLLEDDVRDENYTRRNKFTDVSNDAWYCSAVSTLSAMGIISGYPDATFRPNASITRAEFAAIATRFDVDGDKTPVSFSDIAGHWAKDEIAVAANNGWVNGYEDGSFRPQNNITRAETMSLVNRVLNRKPETPEDLLSNMTTWTDNADTNAWYYLAVQEATNSHYYEFKENSQYEKWTELRETRDWSELDK